MAYTNHTKTVNDALHALLIGEFKQSVFLQSKFEPKFKENEFISYWLVDSDFDSTFSDGENRMYNYEIKIYFNRKVMNREFFENTISARMEQLRQLLSENKTYQPSDVYKWHDAKIDLIEIIEIEEDEDMEEMIYINCEFSLMRACIWA